MTLASALALLRRFWWAPIIAVLVIALLVTRNHAASETNRADRAESALRETAANVTAATAKARADDLANARKVEADQALISRNTEEDYAQKIAALRADYAERLRSGTAEADTSRVRTEDMPSVPESTQRTDAPTCPAPLFTMKDALEASETAERLIALQEWVRRQGQVER